MQKAKIAVIGAGVIGQKHIERLLLEPEADLVAIADPAPATRDRAGDNNASWYADYDQMLKAERPDGVVVSTPTELHCAPAIAALEAGAHLLIEKPITATLEEAERIASLAEKKALHVLVGHHRRYYPLVHRAREIVSRGEIGDLLAVNAQWTVYKPDEYYEADWRKRREAGPVLTNLVHDMDLLRYICGEVDTVQAATSNMVRGFEKEDVAAIVLRFANGALATVLISDSAASPWAWEFATGENPAFASHDENAFRFIGSKGALEFPKLVMW